MFSIVIFFVSSSFGFLSIAKFFGKNKYQEHKFVNKYLFLIIAVNSIRFLFHGISLTYPESHINNVVKFLNVIQFILMPCYYLYFHDIINEDKFDLKNLYHFIVPFWFGAIFIVSYLVKSINLDLIQKLLFLVSILFYIVSAFHLLYKNVWKRKTEIKVIQKQNNLIKNWTIFLFLGFLMLGLVRIFSVFYLKDSILSTNYLWVSALLWLSILVKLNLSPEILYGYSFLNKTLNAEAKKLNLSGVWLTEGTVAPINMEREKILAPKIKSLIMEYLHQIEELSFHSQAFRNPDYSLNDMAAALNIPISHINFIFKYHCNESFSDYKKIVRINDATKLLENGYLNKHKVETLAAFVGFTSYNTFSIAFKSITGVTTQEYLKRT
jgi:AraC-like DNA-binding protein